MTSKRLFSSANEHAWMTNLVMSESGSNKLLRGCVSNLNYQSNVTAENQTNSAMTVKKFLPVSIHSDLIILLAAYIFILPRRWITLSYKSADASYTDEIEEKNLNRESTDWEISKKCEVPNNQLKIFEKMGQGTFGTVNRGELWETVVAVKRIHYLHPKVMQEFAHEVQILK